MEGAASWMKVPSPKNISRLALAVAYTRASSGSVSAGTSMSARATCRKLNGLPLASAAASARVTTSYGGAATRAASSGTGRQARNGRKRIGPPFGVGSGAPAVRDATGATGRASRAKRSSVNGRRSSVIGHRLTSCHLRTSDDLPALHHESHPAKISDRHAGISLAPPQARQQPGLNPAEPLVEMKDPRIARGRRAKHVQDRHAVLRPQHGLAGVV